MIFLAYGRPPVGLGFPWPAGSRSRYIYICVCICLTVETSTLHGARSARLLGSVGVLRTHGTEVSEYLIIVLPWSPHTFDPSATVGVDIAECSNTPLPKSMFALLWSTS